MLPAKDSVQELAAVTSRLAGRLRAESRVLVDMAQAISDGKWADMLHATAEWTRVSAGSKRDAALMQQLMAKIDKATIRQSLKATGLTAEEAAVIFSLGGTDGWD